MCQQFQTLRCFQETLKSHKKDKKANVAWKGKMLWLTAACTPSLLQVKVSNQLFCQQSYTGRCLHNMTVEREREDLNVVFNLRNKLQHSFVNLI